MYNSMQQFMQFEGKMRKQHFQRPINRTLVYVFALKRYLYKKKDNLN